MTVDKATYTIKFPNSVPTTMAARIESHADPDLLDVEISESGNHLTVAVQGDGHVIPVFERRIREQELGAYPSVKLECDVQNADKTL